MPLAVERVVGVERARAPPDRGSASRRRRRSCDSCSWAVTGARRGRGSPRRPRFWQAIALRRRNVPPSGIRRRARAASTGRYGRSGRARRRRRGRGRARPAPRPRSPRPAHGLSVVCVDKAQFPRDKTCGDGLTDAALRLLERLGLVRARSRRRRATSPSARRVVVSPSGRQAHSAAPDRRRPRGRGRARAASTPRSSRSRRAARRRRPRRRDGRGARDQRRRREGAAAPTTSRLARAIVIAADGHWSTVRRRSQPDAPRDLGEWHAVRQYFDGVDDERLWVLFERDLLPGYAWVFPLPGGGANVGYGVLRADGRSGRELKELWPDLLARPRAARRSSAANAHAARAGARVADPDALRTRRASRDGRVLFAGDAAGVVDPMTGEGHRAGARDRHARGRGDRRRRRRRLPSPTLPRTVAALGRDLRFAAPLQRVLAPPARRARRDPRRRPHALDPPQLRPLDVRGLSARGARHARPLAPRALHGAGRVLADSRRLVDLHRQRATREYDMADGKSRSRRSTQPRRGLEARRASSAGSPSGCPASSRASVDGDVRTIGTMGIEIKEQLRDARRRRRARISYSSSSRRCATSSRTSRRSRVDARGRRLASSRGRSRSDPTSCSALFLPVYEGSVVEP